MIRSCLKDPTTKHPIIRLTSHYLIEDQVFQIFSPSCLYLATISPRRFVSFISLAIVTTILEASSQSRRESDPCFQRLHQIQIIIMMEDQIKVNN